MIKILNNDSSIIEGDYNDNIDVVRHSASHVMAEAIKKVYPDVKLAIGPATADGFYYDFDNLDIAIEDLRKIENIMRNIIAEKKEMKVYELKYEDALLKMKDEPYKIEMIEDLGKDAKITFYDNGTFVDMCKGPHLLNLKDIGEIKLLSVTGAYFKGSEKNKMLTRIYGTCFKTKEELEKYLEMKEEAKKRDHNKLGRELKIFTTVDEIGQGLPLYCYKGAKMLQILQRFVEDKEEKMGYLLTKTPFMAKSDLYKLSGHWDHYKEGMFILGDEEKDKEILALRPMTCPFQYMIYKNDLHSYKELPIRYSETSTLFRNEASGEMHGMIRVRQFTISEGHIIVRPDQLEEIFDETLNLVYYMLKVLGFENEVTFRFSKWDPDNREKYIDDEEKWNETQDKMKKILDNAGIKYEEKIGEAAFYGPKLDVQYKNVHGKEDTIITIQIDCWLAKRFDMTYVDKDGTKKTPYIIHRTSIGCYDRTLAMLIEKHSGAFPLWLAVPQLKILTISDMQIDYAKSIKAKLESKGFRVELDEENEKIGYKVRNARLEKIPYMLVIGDKEVETEKVSVKSRTGEDLGQMSLDELISKLKEEIKESLGK